MGLLHMSRHGLAVPPAEDGMCVDARCTIWGHCDVADERRDLHLLLDGDRRIAFRLPIEIRQLGAAQSPDCRDLGSTELLALSKALQAGHRLVAGLQDDGEGSLAVVFVQDLSTHGALLRWN